MTKFQRIIHESKNSNFKLSSGNCQNFIPCAFLGGSVCLACKVILKKSCSDLGWVWPGWQYWKKKFGRLWATLDGIFFMFSWASALNNKLDKMKINFFKYVGISIVLMPIRISFWLDLMFILLTSSKFLIHNCHQLPAAHIGGKNLEPIIFSIFTSRVFLVSN